jgi:hypothetical protein
MSSSTSPALPALDMPTASQAVSWTDKALSVLSTASLVIAGSVVMLMLLATPGQPLDALFQTGSCGLSM